MLLRRFDHRLLTLLVCAGSAPPLLLAGCGAEDDPGLAVPNDATILQEYFAANPGIPAEHHAWHAGTRRLGAHYGSSFLLFHRGLVARYEQWRQERGYGPLLPWDPATPIPRDVPHAGRRSENPSVTDPDCRRPSWLTIAGGAALDPDVGATSLGEFTSLDQLGYSIDSMVPPNWHSRVHETIGGDIENPSRVPFDPIFWRWHKYLDLIVIDWEAAVAAFNAPTAPTGSSPSP